jgi:hypothetical protein
VDSASKRRPPVKDLKTKPFALLGVNIFDREPKKLKEIMEKDKITWRSIASHPLQIGRQPRRESDRHALEKLLHEAVNNTKKPAR